MPIVADAAVAIRGDLSKFRGDLSGAEKQTQNLGQKLNAALSPKNLAAGLGIGLGIAQVTSFFGDAIQAAGEFQDSVSATGVIFGEEAIPALQEWANEAHSAFGSSKQDALAAANQFAVFGKSAGLVGNDLTEFSTKLVQLGGDLASMFGGRTEDAITAVGSALRGEFEPIRAYGVLLDDATLRQQAFEMGIISSTKNALTPQQRVLAAQASIFAQTSDAQGDFARTSDGLMNTQRDLAAELENVSIEVGEKLLPIMLDFVTFVRNDGIPIMREFIDLLDFGDAESAQGIPVLGEIEDLLNNVANSGVVLHEMLAGREGDLRDAAAEMGVSFMEMQRLVHESMLETGEDHHAAIAGIIADQAQLAVVLESGTAWETYQEQIRAGGAGIDAAAAEMADGIPGAMEDALAAGEEIARQTPGALANELRAGIEEYDAALEELTVVAESSVSDLAERQKIEGILASTELTDALNSDSTRTRLLAADLVTDLVSDYELLAPGALGAGELVNPNLSAGINSNLGLTTTAANAVRNAAGDPLVDLGPQAFGWGATLSANFMAGMSSYHARIRATSLALGEAAATGVRLRSPAEAGPLSEPADKWGRELGTMFAKGMLQSIPGIQNASLAMAGAAALRGSFTGTSPLSSSTGSNESAVAGGMTVNINAPTMPMTPRDIGRELRRTGAFGANS